MSEEQLFDTFKVLAKHYHLKGMCESFSMIKTGNINDTYVLNTRLENGEVRQYTVQRINHYVFKQPEQVASNAYAVTSHIEKKMRQTGEKDIRRRVLHFYPKDDGSFFTVGDDGSYWRIFSYVYDSLNTNEADETILYGTGEAFGAFQRYLADFPAETLYETIPDFHNTPKRFSDLKKAMEADVCGRASEVRTEYGYLRSMEHFVHVFERLHEKGKLPLRVVHNDTKCNNVMFDKTTRAPLAVIDLDTVMPGFVAFDFGDAVRFACNTASEDEEDLSAVALDLNGLYTFSDGFLSKLRGILTDTEASTLPEGVLLITLELAARFLTDYLCGDVYFKCRKEKHNLIRARCQIALAKDVARKMPEMKQLLQNILLC